MNVKGIAPVLVNVYDRLEHFKKCINSLKKNELSNQTHLFVTIDAPYKEEHRTSINKVINYAKKITGFKEVTLFIREKNLGEHKNSLKAINQVFQIYPKLIFTEDDNVFSPKFLEFVNRGLEIYQDREDIFSISGYKFPIKIPKNYNEDVFLWSGFVAWGVGIWKNKWNQVNWSISEVDEFLKNEIKRKNKSEIPEHVYSHLRTIKRTRKITADTMISLHLFKNKMYSIFPTDSRVRNIGHDDSGEHGTKKSAKIFHNQKIYEGSTDAEFPINIELNPLIEKVMKNYPKKNLKTRLKRSVKKVLKTMSLFNK